MKLVLEDGTEWPGEAFGAPDAVAGEVVFNTGMTGYVETLTDPSYRGQILVATYPLFGNYGVAAARPPGSLDAPYESGAVQVQGLVVQNYVDAHSHHAARRSLGDWLRAEGVAAITGIDTRTLTRRLRHHGTMRGWLLPADAETDAKAAARSVDMRREVFRLVAPAAVQRYGTGRPTILLVDVGAKDNIVRSLLHRGAGVVRVPWHEPWRELATSADAVVFGNGPGNPKDLLPLVFEVRKLLESYTRPVFGICLGHQILALAAGADTFKLPYGHRGVNQPVRELSGQRSYITSQNHGYAVDDETLPADWEPWFVNINDGTNEGLRARNRPFMSVQFHPEASPGPEDTGHLFDDFLSLVRKLSKELRREPIPSS